MNLLSETWSDAVDRFPVGLLGGIPQVQLREIADLRFVTLDEHFGEDGPEASSVESTANWLQEEETARAAAQAQQLQAARDEVRSALQQEFDARLQRMTIDYADRVERMAEEFARDRQRYFAAAEASVVKLALAVARRVLAREAEVEGLPLREAVKAALTRVVEDASTVLYVAPAEFDEWVAFLQDAAPHVQVRADQRAVAEGCFLETGAGRIALGIEVQLAEIERAFAELHARESEA